MNVYRICKKEHANLEGLGGIYSWGRWHRKGQRVVYTSESRSLSALETLVHVTDINILPSDLVVMEIDIPKTNIKIVTTEIISEDWNSYPYSEKTVNYGYQFLIDNKALALKVPSVVIEKEYNYILNPNHKDYSNCTIKSITPFSFDKRLSF